MSTLKDCLYREIAESLLTDFGVDRPTLAAILRGRDLPRFNAPAVTGGHGSLNHPNRLLQRLLSELLSPDLPLSNPIIQSEPLLQTCAPNDWALLLLLAETRFHLDHLKLHLDYFFYWSVVFSLSWDTQRSMTHESDAESFIALVPHNSRRPAMNLCWFNSLAQGPAEYYETWPKGYAVLRGAYFPERADCAVAGFAKHYRHVDRAAKNLRKRTDRLEQYHQVQGSALLRRCLEKLDLAKAQMEGRLVEAKAWFKSKMQKARHAELPGTCNGFVYGQDLHVQTLEDSDIPPTTQRIVWPCGLVDSPATHSPLQVGRSLSPARLGPGSSWDDWLRPPEFYSMRYREDDDPPPVAGEPEPDLCMVDLPQTLTPILKSFSSLYASVAGSMAPMQGANQPLIITDPKELKVSNRHDQIGRTWPTY